MELISRTQHSVALSKRSMASRDGGIPMENMSERKLDADERPKRIYTATFQGSGAFPVDMLRYDQCWPRIESEMPKLAMHHSDRAYFEVRTVTVSSYKPFTERRWESFGWT